MSDELERAARYLQKAEELRAIASGDDYKQTREAMLSVAETYERLAQSMQRIHETNLVRRGS